MNQKDLNPIALALGLTGALACSSAIAADDPFSMTDVSSGQMVAESDGEGEAEKAEGAEGEGNCGEGKCGEGEKEGAEGEGNCGEGKCGGNE